MTRPASFLLLFAACSFAFAQEAPATGGWRRADDRPPQTVGPPPAAPLAQDPSQPMDRTDAYGQPMQASPRPAPAYGAIPPELTVNPGTFVTVRINQPLSSDQNQPGDPFSGSLMQPLVVDGIVLANRGQMVYGRVAEAQKSKSGNPSRLGLELTSLTLADGTQTPVRTQLVGRQGSTTPAGEQFGTVATTTTVGAAVGAVADWGRGAAIGAGVGAAAGIIGVMLTRNHPTVVYPETALTFRVEAPIVVSTVRAPQAFRFVDPSEYDRPEPAQLQQRGPAPRPVMAPYPYYYPYYWGSGVSIFWGRPYFYGRGYYRRWR